MFSRLTGLLIFLLLISNSSYSQEFYLPINVHDRVNISQIKLTHIGSFGEERKARPGIPAHLHTGIDIKRPAPNYNSEPIFSIGEGVVISMRDDGPYAQIIIENTCNDKMFWTVYEHIAGIKVGVGDFVDSKTEIARFMNKQELNKFGWQFDHFHFEILKVPPKRIKPCEDKPQRFFKTYNLTCYNIEDLNNCYYNPMEFMKELMQ